MCSIHAGFDGTRAGVETDRLAIETLDRGGRAGGAGRPRRPDLHLRHLGAGPDAGAGGGRRSAESGAELVAYRPAHEQMVLSAAGDGLRTVVVRPGIVYGGSRGIVGDLFRDAINGVVRVIGNGENRWPAVYDRDLADLYLLPGASAPTRPACIHANDEGDERVNDIVEAIVAHVRRRPTSGACPLEEARAKLGLYAVALALDQVVRSPRARALGWSPILKSVGGNVARLFEEWRGDSAARAQEATSGPPTPDRPAATRSRRRNHPAGE